MLKQFLPGGDVGRTCRWAPNNGESIREKGPVHSDGNDQEASRHEHSALAGHRQGSHGYPPDGVPADGLGRTPCAKFVTESLTYDKRPSLAAISCDYEVEIRP